MKKLSVLFACLVVCIVSATGVLSKEHDTVKMLPTIVAQACGQANTIIMWHDINIDGQADYKTTYVFKDGKLHQLDKNHTTQDELGYLIRRR